MNLSIKVNKSIVVELLTKVDAKIYRLIKFPTTLLRNNPLEHILSSGCGFLSSTQGQDCEALQALKIIRTRIMATLRITI